MQALIYALVSTISMVINIYIWIIIIAALLSFVRPDPSNPLVQAIYSLTEPVFRWVREKLPFVVVGTVDLSPIVIILALQFINIFLWKLIS